MRWALLAVGAGTMIFLAACQPAKPPPTPLPTKEQTINKVKTDIDKAMQKAHEARESAESESSPDKKGP